MKRRYITGIDGLRTIAVLFVIGYHLMPKVFKGGYLGVVLFFVISGFLITDTLYRMAKISLKEFYWKRIKRLWPSLIVLFLVSGYVFVLLNPDSLVNFHKTIATTFLSVNNWWQLSENISYFDKFSQTNSFVNLWSLSIECQFYIIWPIVFMLYRKVSKDFTVRKLPIYLFLVSLLSAVLMGVLFDPNNVNRVYYGTDTRIFAILIGCILGIVIHTRNKLINKYLSSDKKYTFGFIVIITLLILTFTLPDSSKITYYGGMYIYSVLCGLLLLLILKSRVFNRLFTNKFFEWCGSRSYEIYLWQLPVISVYERLFDVTQLSWLHPIVELVIIVGLSELTYRAADIIRHFDFTTIKNRSARFKKCFIIGSLVIVLTFVPVLVKGASMNTNDSDKLQQDLAKKEAMIKKHQKELQKQKNKPKQENTNTQANPNDPQAVFIQQANALQYTAIGDSVLLDASVDLMNLSPNAFIDAQVGRQVYQSVDLFKQYQSSNQFKPIVVIALGTNGSFTQDQINEILDCVKDKEVYLVNVNVPRPWQDNVNTMLSNEAKKRKNCHLIDWYNYSKNHPEWFGSDQVHMGTEGSKQYADFVTRTIIDTQSKKSKKDKK